MLLLPFPATADKPAAVTESSYEDILSGFDDDGLLTEDILSSMDEETAADRWWDLSGSVTLSSVWNIAHESPDHDETDHRGLSRLRTELELVLEADFSDSWRGKLSGRGFYDFAYNIRGRHDYTREVLNDYEDESEFRESYIEGDLTPNLNLRVGRQVLVWGNSETFRVTDILNPLDNRDPGVVDIEYLRLPVFMGRMDYSWRNSSGYYNLTGIIIPELRFNKDPVYGNDFYPFDYPLPHEETPGQTFDKSEFALALKGVFHNWDLSLYGAHFYNDECYLEKAGEITYPVFLPDGSMLWQSIDTYERRHARLWMAGMSVNLAVGDWLFKTELARFDGFKYATTSDEKAQTRALAGFEYTGLTDITLTLEFMQTCIHDFEHCMRSAPDYADSSQLQTSFRYTQDLMNNRLELVFVAIVMGVDAKDGLIERLTASYDVTDNFTVTAGCVFYQEKDNDVIFHNLHDNNRVLLDLKYSF